MGYRVKERLCAISNKKSIPFLHFTPVRRTGLRINSSYRVVAELFDEMNTSWHEIIKKYRTSITHSEIRTSWLCLTLLSIPNDPNSLTIQRSKIPIGTLSLNVGSVVYNIDWRHPIMSWEDARIQVFESSKETPVLNTVLTSRRRTSDMLEFENNLRRTKCFHKEKVASSLCTTLILFIDGSPFS